MNEIEVIGFDAYGTLFDVSGETWAAPQVVMTARRKQLEYSWLLSLMGDYRDWDWVSRRAIEFALATHGVANADVDGIMDAQLRTLPFPEVAEALSRLGETRRLAIVSNGHPAMLDALCRSAGLRDSFYEIVSADEVRTYKPAPEVYRLALSRLSVARDQLLFVSSNAWDVAGAAHSGLRTAWVNRTNAPAENLGPTPEIVVKDLLELAERLV